MQDALLRTRKQQISRSRVRPVGTKLRAAGRVRPTPTCSKSKPYASPLTKEGPLVRNDARTTPGALDRRLPPPANLRGPIPAVPTPNKARQTEQRPDRSTQASNAHVSPEADMQECDEAERHWSTRLGQASAPCGLICDASIACHQWHPVDTILAVPTPNRARPHESLQSSSQKHGAIKAGTRECGST